MIDFKVLFFTFFASNGIELNLPLSFLNRAFFYIHYMYFYEVHGYKELAVVHLLLQSKYIYYT